METAWTFEDRLDVGVARSRAAQDAGPDASVDVDGEEAWLFQGVDLAPREVHAALASLETVTERLRRRGDPRAAFPDVYGMVTRRIAEECDRPGGVFLEPAWISRCAGRFCERYLETLRWDARRERQDCTIWGLAYRYASLGATLPTQDVILGLSAHINYDLAIGICWTLAEVGAAGDPDKVARFKHDHDAINGLLEEVMPGSYEHLERRYGCRVASAVYHRFGPTRALTGWTTMRVLELWRGRVWRDVLALLEAESQSEAARAEVIAAMERRSALIGRALTAASAAWLQARRLRAHVATRLPARFQPA